ncbi:hypothetical protein V6N11_035774 [Hibiscus sabdariffa]|uniref:Uncharacterized protein n=1 Tax=Hibiscus sabdariffa TaxID=183260 RepID=A0ABR2R8Q5_9ROSI
MLLKEQRSAKKGKSGGADDVWVDSSMIDANNEGGEISNEQIEPKEQSKGESCVVGKKPEEIIQDPAVSGTNSNVDTSAVVSEANLYGPWMVVDRRRRSGQHSLVNRNVKYGGEGSRFSVLQEQQATVGKSQQAQESGTIRTEAYLASNPDRKSKASKKVGGSPSTIPLQNSRGAKTVIHQATIPSGSHQAVRIIEGEGQAQPTTLLKPQRLKGVVSKGSLDTMHRVVMVGKSMTSRMLSQMSPTKFARHLSEQLDAGDPPDSFEEGVDHTVVLNHSSDDDVAFLAEFQPVGIPEDVPYGIGVLTEDH